MTDTARIPVSVLTGFLGSGKTTLLSRALKQPAFSRTAVIINEMGEIGLDHELVAASSESLITLETGCLCCAVRGDLALTLADLLRQRSDGTVAPFERIVIETSGIADPAPILQLLMTDAGLAERLRLSGVATTIDAVHGQATLAREPQAPRQAAVADRLIVTKSDMAGGVPAGLRDALQQINPTADVLVANFGVVDPTSLFADGVYDPRRRSGDVMRWLGLGNDTAAPTEAAHDRAVTSLSIARDAPLHAITLTLLVEALAEHCGADLLRIKGIVQLVECPDQPAIIHGVQHVVHPIELLDAWPSPDRRSHIVMIGRNLNRGWVLALIEALEAEVAETVENT